MDQFYYASKTSSKLRLLIIYYSDRLLYWKENTDILGFDWADFLLDDTRPNKERLLSEKRKLKQ